jgi:hypothetical protein
MFITRKTGREGCPLWMHLFARVVDSRVSLHVNFGKSRVVLNGILCFGIKIQTEKPAKLSTPLLIPHPSLQQKTIANAS